WILMASRRLALVFFFSSRRRHTILESVCGLGDVYKRQCPDVLGSPLQRLALDSTAYSYWAEECKDQAGRPELDPYAATDRYVRPVSYTHLTLPTSELV